MTERAVRLIISGIRRFLPFLLTLIVIQLCAAGVFAQGVRVERIETKERVVNKREAGWEKALTEKDPNLSHWHWEPINNSYKTLQVKRIYEKSHKPLAYKAYTPGVASSSSNDLNGKIMRQAPVSSPAPKPTVYTYGTPSGSPSHLDFKQQTHTDVAGKIIRLRDSNI